MATGTTLLNLRKMLRGEIFGPESEDQAKGIKHSHNTILNRVQEWLYDDFDWPQLIVREDVAMVAGTNLYTIPSNISIESVLSIHTKYAGAWCELDPGVPLECYAEFDSDEDERYTPARRYRQYDATRIEIWPIPSTAGVVATKENYIRIEGVTNYSPLSDDTDTAILDDQVIVLYAAAEILARKKDADAQNKLAMARKRRLALSGKQSKKDTFSLAGGSSEPTKKELRVVYAR